MDVALQEGLRSGEGELKRNLNTIDLTALGVGAIIGTGIFVLTGVGAALYAGPGVILSFVLAGAASALAALVYAELAAMVPVSGSAYTFSYVALGEVIAWVVGWDLILEYSVAGAAVAIGWSGYVRDLLAAAGFALPTALVAPAFAGGVINLPAIAIVVLTALVLRHGTRESATVNAVIVGVKIAVILLFLVIGALNVRVELWRPFLPFGWSGVIQGAAVIFFAYIGFDAVATAAEEVRDPGRQLPRGILYSLVIAGLLYVAVSAVLTGLVPYQSLNVASPLSFALLQAGASWASAAIAVGALAGLTSVLLAVLYAQSRVFYAMARDGLLPRRIARLHPKHHTPDRIILLMSLLVALVAATLPVETVAEMANIGTLAAFILVSGGVIVLRYARPDAERPFRVPFFPLLPLLAIAASAYLMLQLPFLTWMRFVIWLILGGVVYFAYSRRHSVLNPSGDT